MSAEWDLGDRSVEIQGRGEVFRGALLLKAIEQMIKRLQRRYLPPSNGRITGETGAWTFHCEERGERIGELAFLWVFTSGCSRRLASSVGLFPDALSVQYSLRIRLRSLSSGRRTSRGERRADPALG